MNEKGYIVFRDKRLIFNVYGLVIARFDFYCENSGKMKVLLLPVGFMEERGKRNAG